MGKLNTVTSQLQKLMLACSAADSEQCMDPLGLVSAVGVTDLYSRQYIPEKEFFACGL